MLDCCRAVRVLKTASTELTEARAKETVVKQNCEGPIHFMFRTYLQIHGDFLFNYMSDISLGLPLLS